MADRVISTTVSYTGYDAAVSIDAANDFMLIQQSGVYKKISRNVIMGVTGTPADLSTVQVLTNKTIGITNTITQVDNLFTLQDNSDNTKQAQFQLSGITAGQTRTYTLPNASSTLVDLSTSQTLTNKTITAPAITGGTIANSTITVDAIAEFSAANGVTVDGLNIKDGKLNTNNSVVTANITDAAVTPAKLVAGTGSSWTWQTWSPSYVQLTIGNGTVVSKYTQIGKTVFFMFRFIYGNSGSAVGTTPTISLPVTSAAYYVTNDYLGVGFMTAAGTPFFVETQLRSTTVFGPVFWNANSTFVQTANSPTASSPAVFAAGDIIHLNGVYEAA